MGAPTDDRSSYAEAEAKSLGVVQRVLASTAIGLFIGSLSVGLAFFLALSGVHTLPRDSVIGLWVMVGVVGVATVAAMCVVHRRPWYSPLALLGLLPMLISAFWIL